MSSKIAVKSPAGPHQQSKITDSPQWNSSGTTATSSRLAKAKSSPNVSRTSSQQLSAAKQTIKIDDTRRKNNPSSAGSKSSSSAAPKSTARSHNNVTIVQIPGETRSAAPTPRSRTSDARSKKPEAAAPKKKQPLKERSPSCTILEDRVLLKKGLAPVKKPEAELRRKCLNRSTSLWSVQTPPPQESSARKLSKSADSQKPQKKSSRPTLNRATSLWSVPADPQCRLGKMPSRIPLSTQHLGQSLGDLSLVDRPVEQQPAMIVKAIDFDEVDRSVDEHIYENCREAMVVQVNKQEEAIYEELDKVVGKSELTMSLSVPLTTSELEKRAEQLLSQLDEDDSANVIAPVEPVRLHRSKNTENHKENVRQEPLEKSHRLLAKSQDSLQVLSQAVPPSPSKRTECEMSIQEIRRNWERQIEKCSSDELKTSPSKKRLSKSSTNINAGSALSLAADSNKRQQQQQQQQQQVIAAKRTKEIEHLVHFFNCKNTETPKPVVPSIVIQDTWKPLLKDEPVEEITTPSSEKPGKLEKSCGYASDGNSSEDSGHISNENEDEHQQGSRLKSEIFLEEIIQDLDTSLERTIEVFEATPIVRRFVPPSEPPPPVPTSSIESWDDALKLSRKKSIEKLPVPPKPTQRHNVPTSANSAQIFFRAGALERLESQRDEKLTGHIILLQARCRGYLARRKLNTLKLQDLAVRCIQRNVRKLMSVREWPWWRLYVKVAPLLNVHRTEDQLKARTEELEVLRAKVDRLEQERNHLKHDNDRLEAKLSEMTADFAEEHSTSTLAAERIDAEQSERLRLERELQDVSETNKSLQQQAERLEMELLYARAADLNGLASDAEDAEADGGVYKQRYQHAMRELDFTKRKMAQQHEDDLEQLVGLKKQLEKKLADAYEEVEEQRQVVGQWKRRVQKLNGEMHDLRLLLEEQTARNNLLEKKQRKFDSETQNLMDDLRQEKAQRERLAREKEIAIAEKFTIEQNLSDARLEIELKEERLHTLSQELEELTFGGKTEEEVAQLKKAKHELEKKLKDQEEELDDLAGQVQLLEQAKLRLEMSIEQQRKEMRKEMQQRDEELEDVRGSAMKKVKALEAQLENEHEERTIVLREKHELERRLVALEDQDRTERAAEAETTQRLKRDLKRTRALLRDAQTMLERSKGDSTGKTALRHLKNQLEDAECARAVAVKAKQALEQDLSETQAALEEASRQRSEAEDRANAANRERAELLSQLEENEEELAEVLKKYRAAVQQVSAEQAQLQEAQVQIAALEAEKSSLKDQLSELSQRLESVEQLGDPTANSLATRRLEFRTKELESKLELEQTTRARLETQIARLKENVEKLQSETALLRTKEQSAQDAARRLQRSLREAREEAATASAREQEATRARRDLEKALEAAEAETKVVKDDLRLALQRIEDLQSAIQGELDLDCSEEATSDNSDSD
ncbi:unconventional myosin-XVIIIa isoform X6 [Nasonia vitripennis]|uniref:Unconventional myosin-XVIIIa n=1 Tax=Nasonia vitripennis TaxID=7425 RepID=A0A7M7H6G9_NASVI|nr:unconventional myosin-XVIIIa isoform X6 [Nasonia vitripennis]